MAMTARPLTLGEILDRTVQIYRRNFLLFSGIAAVPSALYVFLFGAFGIVASHSLVGMQATGRASLQPALIFFAATGVLCLVGIPLLLGAFAVGQSALNFATVQQINGRAVTARDSFAYSFRFFWRSVGILFLQSLFAWVLPGIVFTVLLVVLVALSAVIGSASGMAGVVFHTLLIVGLMLVYFAVAIWIWLRFCLAFPASVEEGKKVWDAMMRSNRMGKGTRGRIFVMYLMVGILTVVVYYILAIPLDMALGLDLKKIFVTGRAAGATPVLVEVANLTISFLERVFVLPIYAISLVLFYNDQRTRIEGYDIQQLMDRANWQPEQPPPSPAALPVPPSYPLEALPAASPVDAPRAPEEDRIE